MKHKHRLCLLFAATVLSGAAFVSADVGAACPNIIFMLADDLSSHSIGAYGGKRYQSGPKGKLALDTPVRTPNIDRMAAGGMRFTNVLACPVCSPTRGMFLTLPTSWSISTVRWAR